MPVQTVEQQLFSVRQPGTELLFERVVKLVVAELVRRAMWMYEQTTDDGRAPFEQRLTRLEQARLLATATPEQHAQWEQRVAAIPDPEERAKAMADLFRQQTAVALGQVPELGAPGEPRTMQERLWAEAARQRAVTGGESAAGQ